MAEGTLPKLFNHEWTRMDTDKGKKRIELNRREQREAELVRDAKTVEKAVMMLLPANRPATRHGHNAVVLSSVDVPNDGA